MWRVEPPLSRRRLLPGILANGPTGDTPLTGAAVNPLTSVTAPVVVVFVTADDSSSLTQQLANHPHSGLGKEWLRKPSPCVQCERIRLPSSFVRPEFYRDPRCKDHLEELVATLQSNRDACPQAVGQPEIRYQQVYGCGFRRLQSRGTRERIDHGEARIGAQNRSEEIQNRSRIIEYED